MDLSTLGLGAAVAAFGLSAVGSGFGCGIAGMAAIGAWKKCYAQDKPAPLILLAFVGAPMTQTFYGFILMNNMIAFCNKMVAKGAVDTTFFSLLVFGAIAAGLSIGASAMFQGKCAASACDAFIETGKGFANDMIILGMTETIAILTLIFMIVIMGKVAA